MLLPNASPVGTHRAEVVAQVEKEIGLVLRGDALIGLQVRGTRVLVEETVSHNQDAVVLGLSQYLELLLHVIDIEMLEGVDALGCVVGTFEQCTVTKFVEKDVVVILG